MAGLSAALTFVILAPSSGQNRPVPVISYGMSAPDQLNSLGIVALRGKFDASSGILDPYGSGIIVLRNSNVFKLPLEAMVNEARYYAVMSRRVDKIREISVDDFLDWYMGARAAKRTEVLDQIIDAVKAANPTLRFGVTIYENDLPGVQPGHYNDRVMPPTQRNRIDVVHFYVSQRPRVAKLPRYLSIVHREFPNARVYIGLYNQDRREFEHRLSAPEQSEQALFSIAVKKACALVKTGAADGIEFYPGGFGLEKNVYKDKPGQLPAAIAMRQAAFSILKDCSQ